MLGFGVSAQSVALFGRHSRQITPSGPHLHWRINATANNGDASYVAIGEIEMMTAAGGVDQCTGGTASASSQAGAGTTGIYAFDNSAAGQWKSASGQTTGWVSYQFASAKDVVQVTLTAYSGAGATTQVPKDFSIEYSDDGVAWSEAWSVAGQTAWTAGEKRTFTKA